MSRPRGGGRARPAEERFRDLYQVRANGCWEWTGATQTNGYGCFGLSGKSKSVLAHRWAYERFVGPISAGLTIDHLCRVRSCVNPAHLEPVTMKENTARGESPSAKNGRKTHCIRGHLLAGDNLRIKAGKRQCRICTRASQRAGWARSRAA